MSQIEWGQAPLCEVRTPLHVLKLVNKIKCKRGTNEENNTKGRGEGSGTIAVGIDGLNATL
jgi:hypothetical protein